MHEIEEVQWKAFTIWWQNEAKAKATYARKS